MYTVYHNVMYMYLPYSLKFSRGNYFTVLRNLKYSWSSFQPLLASVINVEILQDKNNYFLSWPCSDHEIRENFNLEKCGITDHCSIYNIQVLYNITRIMLYLLIMYSLQAVERSGAAGGGGWFSSVSSFLANNFYW